MTVFTGWPSLKRIIVGIESTWKRAAVCGFSSMSSLTMRSSGRSEAISSSTGATTRQGPHQGAQKSTSTGPSASMTSASKFVSVTWFRVPAIALSLFAFLSLYKMKEGSPAGSKRARGGGPRAGLARRSAEGDDPAFRAAHDRRVDVRQRHEQMRRDVHLDEGSNHENGHGHGH